MKTYVHKKTYRNVHSSFIHNRSNLEGILMGMNKHLWYIHTIEYYSVRKRNKLLIHTTAWVDLKDILLSGRNWTEKLTIYYDYIKFPNRQTYL